MLPAHLISRQRRRTRALRPMQCRDPSDCTRTLPRPGHTEATRGSGTADAHRCPCRTGRGAIASERRRRSDGA